ncbi:MAG: hypothetical protein J6W54_01710 [Fibrobacter sp.]|uniref:hypothetical protein n=1 Tax=Fibrobacter sp. TaxID=35828 RepID=UPI001B0CE64B|nr:hypothetical protein [Fibrobacter sp.]MBO7059802.1 hypothetical protein [Fibrobacter sp.]
MKMIWMVLSFFLFVLVACTETVPTGSNTGEGFYLIADVTSYEFSDEYLVLTRGECVERDGKLVWSKNGQMFRSLASLNKSTDSLRIQYTTGVVRFAYEGNSFPIGMFRSTETNEGVILEEDGTAKFLVLFKNECLYDELGLNLNPGEKRIDCNTTLLENGVEVKYLTPEEGIFKFQHRAAGITCDGEVKRLFPYYEQDCKDAYDMFLKDTSSTKTFEFDNYKMKTTMDSACINDLRVELAGQQGR